MPGLIKSPWFGQISSKFFKDGAEILALPMESCKFVYKQSLFPDQCKIAKLKFLFKEKALRVTRKITDPSHCYLLRQI